MGSANLTAFDFSDTADQNSAYLVHYNERTTSIYSFQIIFFPSQRSSTYQYRYKPNLPDTTDNSIMIIILDDEWTLAQHTQRSQVVYESNNAQQQFIAVTVYNYNTANSYNSFVNCNPVCSLQMRVFTSNLKSQNTMFQIENLQLITQFS